MSMAHIDMFLSLLTGSGVTFFIVTFLAKRLINQQLKKELENHKAQLSAKTEILKYNIAIFSHEQNVATSRVDSQKSQAIHSVYVALRTIVDPVSKISAGCPLVNAAQLLEINYYSENSELAHEKSRDFSKVLADNAIYFSNETYGEIAGLSSSISNLNAIFLRVFRQGEAEGWKIPQLHQNVIEQQKLYSEKYDEIIQPEMSLLTNLFRQELGVHKTIIN